MKTGNIKTYNQFLDGDLNEMIKHQGGRWMLFSKDGKELLGSFEKRSEARHDKKRRKLILDNAIALKKQKAK